MILHINTSKEWRGGENQTMSLVVGLALKNVPQAVLVQPNSPLFLKLQSIPGIDLIQMPIRSEFDWKAILEIRKLIYDKSITLVHAHTAQAHSISFFAKKKSDHWKLIVSRRVDFRMRKNFYSKWKYKSNLVDMYVGVSRKIRDILIEDGINPKKAMTIYSGVDLNRFSKLESKNHFKKETIHKELGIGKDVIVLGITAALADHKDYPTLLRSISKIPESYNLCLFILGTGSLQFKLEQLVKDLGIEHRILFLGFKDNVLPYLKSMDIFCISSKEEGLGTSVLEAMACGLPIVATKGGGIPEMVIDGEGGFLVEIGDSENFADSILRLIQSDSLRLRMGEYNKTKVLDFSIERTIEATYRLYYSYLGQSLSADAPILNIDRKNTSPLRSNSLFRNSLSSPNKDKPANNQKKSNNKQNAKKN